MGGSDDRLHHFGRQSAAKPASRDFGCWALKSRRKTASIRRLRVLRPCHNARRPTARVTPRNLLQRGTLMRRLDGKVAVITGGNQGIGKGIAKLFAEEGARLALCARNAAKLTATANELRAAGVDVFERPVDVGQEPVVEAFFKEVMDRFGRVDILVNNAGNFDGGRI